MSRPVVSAFRRACALLAAAAFCCPPASAASPEAEAAWREILALDSGPPAPPKDRAEALAMAQAHLDLQTRQLERFLKTHPADARRDQARIRLVAIKYARARLPGATVTGEEADRLLAAIESDPATTASGRADARYLRLTEAMQRLARLGPEARLDQRTWLLRSVRDFSRALPSDKRTAGLLVEVGTLFEDQPGERRALLGEALTLLGPRTDATAEALRRRIRDDQKRLALLDRKIDLAASLGAAAPVPGRVSVIAFWASWSAPSLRALEELKRAQATLDFDLIAVSLDEDLSRARALLAENGLRATFVGDGKAWESPAARQLGINALPCLLVVDRTGVVRSTNATGRLAAVLQALPR
ncbi:MAG: TlpA family protein disulfide reductase [Verrucomicrobia bacterium]|nr:TlpA family protein disulfide reductase [Verrucomicrobiota bacterium]